MKRKKIDQVDPATVILLALVFGVAGSRVGMIITDDMWTEDLTIDSIIGGQLGYQWGIVFATAAIAYWSGVGPSCARCEREEEGREGIRRMD